MIRRTCTATRGPDGSYRLRADGPGARGRAAGGTLELRGAWATVWEFLRALSERPTGEQQALLAAMPREHRARLVRAVSLLRRGGFVAFRRSDLDLAGGNGAPPPLAKLHLELTYRCNFRCRGCYLGPRLARPAAAGREGTTSDWIGLVREAQALGCTFATVTGGEPFLRGDVLEILEALSDEAIVAEVNTNGSPVTPRLARSLGSYLISNVAVSIYGYDADSGCHYTGNRQGFQATLRGIRNLVEHGVPVVAKYFATLSTRDGYERVAESLRPLGVDVALVGDTLHGDVFEGRVRDGLRATWEKVPVVQRGALPCLPGGTTLDVEPDGAVRACPKIAVYFGNAFEEGLAAVARRAAGPEAFRRFWRAYCRAEGYVDGSAHPTLCPATPMLSRPGGLPAFQRRWARFEREEHDVRAASAW